jgi:hypothetical protein
MSSSAKAPQAARFPDWNAFAEREAPVEAELLSPAAATASLLQLYHDSMRDAAAGRDEVQSAGLRALAQQAVFVFQLDTALQRYQPNLSEGPLVRIHRHLRVLKDQMMDALTSFGLEIDVPRSRPFEEIAELVHVDGWRHHEQFTAEVVAEVTEPIVKFGGVVVRLGRVVMGAPIDQAATVSETPLDEGDHHADSE